jgi:hypothetical protein
LSASDATNVGLATSTRLRSVLGVWGDTIVGQALVVMLRGSGYDARFLSTSSLSEPESWGDIQLLVLASTPQLSTEHRQARLASLKEALGVTTKEVAVLELITISEEPPEGGEAREESWHVMPWPCKIEELERRISTILSTRT